MPSTRQFFLRKGLIRSAALGKHPLRRPQQKRQKHGQCLYRRSFLHAFPLFFLFCPGPSFDPMPANPADTDGGMVTVPPLCQFF
jgi:hypothetical protein